MTKVTIIGAGNVGATCANTIVFNKIASTVVMIDVKPGIAEGKAIDIAQTAQTLGFEANITGTDNDYTLSNNSNVIVITSGITRKHGMSREELVVTNSEIVKNVISQCLIYSPKAIFVIISNPMDTMTYLTLKSTKLPKNKVIGMGGALDSARFKYYLKKELNCNSSQIEGMVIGGHGDTTMIPLPRLATCNGTPVTDLLSKEKLNQIVTNTMTGGATLIKLLDTSAWYAPGAAGAYVVESILMDYKRIIPSCVYLEGEYGQNDLCIGVPACIGSRGVESIIDIKLNTQEMELFTKSAKSIKEINQILKNIQTL